MEKQQTVLIVEDEKNIVDILRFNLQKEGYATLEAFDGVTGLRLALDENPDLILLDLMLPEMNGFEVCKLLRDKGRSTPVLIITAREEEKDKILGLDLGADDYITKPFSIRELMAPGGHGQPGPAGTQGGGADLRPAEHRPGEEQRHQRRRGPGAYTERV